MLVNTWSSECAPANSSGHLATLEVAEEFLPFFIGGDAVFFAGPQSAAPGQEPQVGLDGFVGVDGLVADCDVDVLVACDDLGDMWGNPFRMASVIKILRKSCGV